MKRTVAPLVAVILASGLVACQRDEPAPGITPATQSVTPTASGSSPGSSSGGPSSGWTTSGTPTQEALLKEAEAVYRAYVPETLKLEEAGGADKLPPVFDKYLMEPYRTTVETTYQNLRASGAKIEGVESVQLRAISAIDASARAGATVGLTACLDGSRATVRKRDRTTEPGSIVNRKLYFKRDSDGVLKIFSSQAVEVRSC